MLSNRRRLIRLGATLPMMGLLARLAPAWARLGVFDAMVDARARVASSEGRPVFASIRAALDAAPADASIPWRIWIRAGRYREKLTVSRDNVHFIGEGAQHTVLSFDAYAGQDAPTRSGKWTTWGCATLILRGKGFSARDMRIENDFDFLANDARENEDPARIADPQAVALMCDEGADRCAFFNVELAGYQDTLFVNAGRSYFRACRISGNVDFIFGAGLAVFEACDIVTRPRHKPGLEAPLGFVAAPSTHVTQAFGLVFLRCRLLRESEQVPPASHLLGRPWHPRGDPDAIGQAVFIECFMDEHIGSAGWAPMASTRNGQRVWFQPEDARLFEYRSQGPGAHRSATRRQLEDITPFSLPTMLGDWQPA